MIRLFHLQEKPNNDKSQTELSWNMEVFSEHVDSSTKITSIVYSMTFFHTIKLKYYKTQVTDMKIRNYIKIILPFLFKLVSIDYHYNYSTNCTELIQSPQYSFSTDSPTHSLYNDFELEKALLNTIWIVPHRTLACYLTIDGIPTLAKDQTVWLINTYDRGYFFGNCYGMVNDIQSKFIINGSVTPDGAVLINFNTEDGTTTVGIGKLMLIGSTWQFMMQMNTSNNSSGASHWSYMISVTPENYRYHDLPGYNISVPEFIKQFD